MASDMRKQKSAKPALPVFTPPKNFGVVEKGIYRSAYPTMENLSYLQHIRIKTIVSLSVESFTGNVLRALKATTAATASLPPGAAATAAGGAGKSATSSRSEGGNGGGIHLVEVADLRSWQNDGLLNDGDDFSQRMVQTALGFAVDSHWHPVLFVCPTGEIQVSVVVGCLRRYQYWSLAAIFSECELFCSVCRELRRSIMSFIEMWDPEVYPISEVDIQSRKRRWLALLRAEQAKDERKPGKRRDRGGRIGTAGVGKTRDISSDSSSSTLADQHLTKRSRTHFASDTDSSDSERASSPPETSISRQETDLIGTSGQLPPAARRRAAKKAEAAKHGLVLAEWYVKAMALRDQHFYLQDRVPSGGPAESLFPRSAETAASDALPAPHLRYAGVRNPPALDERSSFTKESVVEEDDD